MTIIVVGVTGCGIRQPGIAKCGQTCLVGVRYVGFTDTVLSIASLDLYLNLQEMWHNSHLSRAGTINRDSSLGALLPLDNDD